MLSNHAKFVRGLFVIPLSNSQKVTSPRHQSEHVIRSERARRKRRDQSVTKSFCTVVIIII